MSKLKVWIPEPCHKTWKEMDTIQNSTSRHCRKCSVDLVDFTKMSDDEMIAYLSARKAEKVCVRMYAADALTNVSKSQKLLRSWHKIISSSQINSHLKALILIILGSVLLTACGGGDDGPPCNYSIEVVPDTTTADPTDSIEVMRCD